MSRSNGKREAKVRWYEDQEALAREAAGLILEAALESVKRKGFFAWVLSGGETPRALYKILAAPPFFHEMPWQKAHLFWGDERCVPPYHPWSNFHMAQETLLSKVPIPQSQVHPILAGEGDPEKAARAYEKHLREFWDSFDVSPTEKATKHGPPSGPGFDLVLLGMGADGHTASLFPGDEALLETRRWVAAVHLPRGTPPVPRVTLTLPAINAARDVLILVSGKNKHEVVRKVLEGKQDDMARYPVGMVKPRSELIWLVQV